MTVTLHFIVKNRSVGDYIGRMKLALVPKEFRNSGHYSGRNISVSTLKIERIADAAGLIDSYFSSLLEGTERVIVICEESFRECLVKFSQAFFVIFFDSNKIRASAQNFFSQLCAQALRYFQAVEQFFSTEGNLRLLLLPLDNFHGAEIVALRELFETANDGNIGNRLGSYLSSARARQKPKRVAGDRAAYIVDDLGRHFKYGLERHGRPEGSCPPHLQSCVSCGGFRFGVRLDDERHYNVSCDGVEIAGEFSNCHGVRSYARGTHLNMFPNGYFVTKTK